MGRDLQKRKNRSSRPTIRQSNRLKKPLNPLGNSLVARNWLVVPITPPPLLLLLLFFPGDSHSHTQKKHRNKKETLSQNYRRLGLTAKLGKAPGGIEANPAAPAAQDPLAVTQAASTRSAIRSVQVERDAAGNIVKVLHRDNPLNDPLNDLESSSGDDETQTETRRGEGEHANRQHRETKVVDLLEQQANVPTESYKRHQSAREREWIERLVAKHGQDVAAMARDMRLNPMQQTVGEIKKKLKKYQQESSN